MREITSADIVEIATTLADHKVDYVIFGGVALNIHGIIRSTVDIDIFIRNKEQNIDNFFTAFNKLSMFTNVTKDQVDELKEYTKKGIKLRYGVIKLGGEIDLDLTVEMGINNIDTLEAEEVEFKDVKLNVITLQQLYNMKKDSYRQRDQDDVGMILKLRGNDIK